MDAATARSMTGAQAITCQTHPNDATHHCRGRPRACPRATTRVAPTTPSCANGLLPRATPPSEACRTSQLAQSFTCLHHPDRALPACTILYERPWSRPTSTKRPIAPSGARTGVPFGLQHTTRSFCKQQKGPHVAALGKVSVPLRYRRRLRISAAG